MSKGARRKSDEAEGPPKRDPKQEEIAAEARLYFLIAGHLWRDSYYNEDKPTHLPDLKVGLGLAELSNWVGAKEKIVAGILLTHTTMFEDFKGFMGRKEWRLTRAGLVTTGKRYGAREPISGNAGETWLAYPELETNHE